MQSRGARRRRGLWPMLGIILVVACACTRIVANKAPDYAGEPKRMVMVDVMMAGDGRFRAAAIEQRVIERFTACGVEVHYFLPPAPIAHPSLVGTDAVDANRKAMADTVSKFAADTVLTINETIERRSEGLTSVIVEAAFAIELVDTAAHKVVWKAQIVVRPQYVDGPQAFADQLVGRLAQDGILRSCPGAPRPAPPA